MRVGYQTIIWGPTFDNLDIVLQSIAAAGYQGVEFAQAPGVLAKDIHALLGMLRKHNLELVGLAGGTLRERMEFCGDFRPPYLYLEEWGPDAAEAVRRGFVLALHPSMYKPVGRLVDAQVLLRQHPGLKLLPDTAHQTAAGDDPIEAIRLGGSRLAAVHLKDWAPVGRSRYRYAAGFTELGRGSVDLEAVLAELQRIQYGGWILAAQDSTRKSPEASMVDSAQWLFEHDLLPAKPPPSPTAPSIAARVFRLPPGGQCTPQSERDFLRSLTCAAAEDFDTWFASIAKAFRTLTPCTAVTIWLYTEAKHLLTLAAADPSSAAVPPLTVKSEQTLSDQALSTGRVIRTDLTDRGNRDRLARPHFPRDFSPTQMVSLPILNPWNSAHVWMLVNLFSSGANLALNDDELAYLGRHVALAADRALDEKCTYVAARANLETGRSTDVKGLLESLRMLIQEVFDCEGVSIFRLNKLRNRLEVGATSGIEWFTAPNKEFYTEGHGLVGTVWHRKEAMLTPHAPDEPGQQGRSSERVDSPERCECLYAPLTNAAGEVLGVIRCRNRRPSPGNTRSTMFSDQDAALLDAIGQAVGPRLDVLISHERRMQGLSRLMHDLAVPIVAIRGAAQELINTPQIAKLLGYDFPQDIWSWCELMARLLNNASIYPYMSDRLELRIDERVNLLAQVVAPAVRRVDALLKERRFSPNRISYGTFEQIPGLWIDRNLFQQVLFNLLSNAIKHCFADSNSFQVDISGRRVGEQFLIEFRDWGPGIERGDEEAVFEDGFRGQKAIDRVIAGQGIGLWVVREAIRAHGGDVKLTHHKTPTEFTIYLPQSLETRPPVGPRANRQRVPL